MDEQRGRFENYAAKIETLRVEHGRKYGPSAPLPTLSIGEVIELKGLPLVVTHIKQSGGLKLEFSGKLQIGFGPEERPEIKGVPFRVTWQSGRRLGLKMVKTGTTVHA